MARECKPTQVRKWSCSEGALRARIKRHLAGAHTVGSVAETGITELRFDSDQEARPQLRFENTADGADKHAEVKFLRTQDNPADNDQLGEVKFSGNADSGTETRYASIRGYSTDVTEGSEDGLISFNMNQDGTEKDLYKFHSDYFTILDGDLYLEKDGGAIKFGDNQDVTLTHNHDTGLTLQDGRTLTVSTLSLGGGVITSTYSELNLLDGSTAGTSVAGKAVIADGTNNDVSFTSAVSERPILELENTNADALAAGVKFNKNSASPADYDVLGVVDFYGDDDGGNSTRYASIRGYSEDVTNTEEDGLIRFNMLVANSATDVYAFGATSSKFVAPLEIEIGSTLGATGFILDANDTDQIAMSIEAAQIDADVLDIGADAVTTAKVIDITADALTTGNALYIDSNSSSTGTRNLVEIINNHASATGATVLKLQNDSTGAGTLTISSAQTTTDVIDITADSATTGKVIDITADALTTGNALYIDSNASNTSTRNLVEIINNHASATGATVLKLQQDSTGLALNVAGSQAISGKLSSSYANHNNFAGDLVVEGDMGVSGSIVFPDNEGLTFGDSTDSTLKWSSTTDGMSWNTKELLIYSTTADAPEVTIMNMNTDANPPTLVFSKKDASGGNTSMADDDELGEIIFRGADSAENTTTYVDFRAFAADVTNGTEDGQFIIRARKGGSLVPQFQINPNYGNTGYPLDATMGANAPGGGFNAANVNIGDSGHTVISNGEYVSTFLIDIGAGSIVSSGDAGDVIGKDDVSAAYFTRVKTSVNGVVYGGRMACIEVPTTGDPDINLCANTSATIAEDAAGEGQHVLVNGGTWTLGASVDLTIPSGGIINDYLYLTHGGTTAGTYDAGKFIIRLFGASF